MKRFVLILFCALLAHSGWSQCSAAFNEVFVGDTLFEATNVSTGFTPNSTLFVWFVTDSAGTVIYIDSTYNPLSNFSGSIASLINIDPLQICLTVFDTSLNCVDSICNSVSMPCPSSMNVSSSFANPSCAGFCNGAAAVVSLNNAYFGPASFLWSNATTSSSTSNLCAGTYQVTVTDSAGCSAIDTITLADPPALQVTVVDSGSLCQTGSVSLTAIQLAGLPAVSFIWSDGSVGPINLVSFEGLYEVTISDSSGCNATDSFLVVNDSVYSSLNSFDETCFGCCDGLAYAAGSGGSGNGFSYLWSTGSTDDSLIAVCAGTYSVTVSDISSGCTSTGDVDIGTPNPCLYEISGNISPSTQATVYLIEESLGILTLLDSVEIDSGFYSFNGLCGGTYYVKAALRPASSQFGNYLPTYYISNTLWSSSNALVLSGSANNIDINLIQGTNLGGPGFIGGSILQGANRAEGDPVAGADVLLLDMQDQALAITKSDVDGIYSFDAVPNGDYKVMVDLLNYAPIPHLVSISDEDAFHDSEDFVVERGLIIPVEPLGLSPVLTEADIHVYPNPVDDHLIIEGKGLLDFELYQPTGQRIMKLDASAKDRSEFNCSDLPAGHYILKVNGSEGSSFHPLIKQ